MERFSKLRLALWSLVLCALIAVGWFALVQPRMQPSLPTDTLGIGDYQLTTADGEPFSQTDLEGQPTAVFFGFTHCPDVCPTTLGEILGWQEDLATEDKSLRVLFFTVDPERDTADVLRDYVSVVPGVTGITGSRAEMDKAIKAFKVYAEKVPMEGGDYTMNHSSMVLLFDDSGRYAGVIGYQEDHDRAMASLRELLAS